MSPKTAVERAVFCFKNCGADQDTHSIYFIHTLKININIQSWLQVETDSRKWEAVKWFPSASCCLFTLMIYHILCVIAHFFQGVYLFRCLFVCFFHADKYLLWFFDKVYPTKRISNFRIKTRGALICREQLGVSLSAPHPFKLKFDQSLERLMRAWLWVVKGGAGASLLFSAYTAAGKGRKSSTWGSLSISRRFEDVLSVIAGDRHTHGERADGRRWVTRTFLDRLCTTVFCSTLSSLSFSLSALTFTNKWVIHPPPRFRFASHLIWFATHAFDGRAWSLTFSILSALQRSPTLFLQGCSSFLGSPGSHMTTHAPRFSALLSVYSIFKGACLCNWIKRGYIWVQTLKSLLGQDFLV